MTLYLSEFGMLDFELTFNLRQRHRVASWYLPKRARKILAEGRLGSKTGRYRLVIYRGCWVSETGNVQFISGDYPHELVTKTGKKFRCEAYDGTTLLLQTNDLLAALEACPE